MGRSLLVERALLALLLVVLAPVECGAGPWWGCLLYTSDAADE